jgi:hypothetical protein
MLYQKEEGVVTTRECGKLKKINEPILEATKKTTIFAPLHPKKKNAGTGTLAHKADIKSQKNISMALRSADRSITSYWPMADALIHIHYPLSII